MFQGEQFNNIVVRPPEGTCARALFFFKIFFSGRPGPSATEEAARAARGGTRRIFARRYRFDRNARRVTIVGR